MDTSLTNAQKTAYTVDNKDYEEFYKIANRVHVTHSFPESKRKPGYQYYLAIYNSPNFPVNHIQLFQEAGYHFVYADGEDIADRANVPREKPNSKSAPLIVTLRSGRKAVWLEIETIKLQQWFKNQATAYKKQIMKAVGSKFLGGIQYNNLGELTAMDLRQD